MFPIIKHIDDVLPAIAGKPEFIVVDKGDYKVIDYVYAHRDTFTGDSVDLLRECRGLKFHKDGRILARAYHKFHNLNEVPSTAFDAIDWEQPHQIDDKLDGSMVHAALIDGQVRFMTRMGESEQALQALRFAEKEPVGINYLGFCRWALDCGFTPIFEWTAPYNRIVVPYDDEMLTLTGLRDTILGNYIDIRYLRDVPIVNSFGSTGGKKGAGSMVDAVRQIDGEEGVVLKFKSGLFVKIKAELYCMHHRAKDGMHLEKNALAVIMEDKDDDLYPLLSPVDADRLKTYAMGVRYWINERAEFMEGIVANMKNAGFTKKQFAHYLKTEQLRIYHGPLFLVWDGADPREALSSLIKKNLSNQTDVDKIRPLIGGTSWNFAIQEKAA